MAEKKVILKDGTDELLPKTSASMVFTESGQTVEAALQNAGGGGTGDSGIVDITSIYSKLNIQNGGIMGSEDLTALKGYIAAGKVLKATMDGTTLTFSYNTSDTLITLSSSPMVISSAYGAMMVISLLVDPETGEYVGVTDESRGQLVQQMIPSNVNAAQLCTMNGYTKPSAYSAISQSDNLNTAIGKLEAGIGNGGAGGGDDTYFINSSVASLGSGSTTEEIYAAFGGKDKFNEAVEAASKKKKIYIWGDSLFLLPVSTTFLFGVIGFFSFTYVHSSGITIKYLTESEVREYYPNGYNLSPEVYSLESDSDSDDISTAVKGESGLKKIIRAVKDGNRLRIKGAFNDANLYTDVIVNICNESENGDMALSFTIFGQLQGNSYFGGSFYAISYTKSSNTFLCNVIPIAAMGS